MNDIETRMAEAAQAVLDNAISGTDKTHNELVYVQTYLELHGNTRENARVAQDMVNDLRIRKSVR